MDRTLTTTTLVLSAVAVGVVAYAAYFDYKRRNDNEFRKKLRKDKKRVDKSVSQMRQSEAAQSQVNVNELRSALETIKNEDVPASAEQKEQYFMQQVSIGEQLSIQGPAFHMPAALAFFRAMRVYPSPVELMVVYERTTPEPIFKIILQLTSLETKDRVEGYHNYFPAKSMNVSVQTINVGQESQRKVLVLTKDVKAGEVIYKEQPVVAALDFDLHESASYCSHCLRHIQKGMAIRPDGDDLNSVFCSKDCQVKSNAQSRNMLFTLEPPLPPTMAPELSTQAREDRRDAQKAWIDYVKSRGKAVPLLVARFIARQVAAETSKMIPGPASKLTSEQLPPTDGGDYTLNDHMERLRYIDIEVNDKEPGLFRDLLQTVLPGLEQFIVDDRYQIMSGKMAYNAYGVCYGGGRDDKPTSTERPEDMERTRTPYGTSRQIGSALYLVSSYIPHSCQPSARPSFSSGTAELHLIASRDLKAGDELSVAYVDVNQREGESLVDCRRRRRIELARGWKFACTCARCASEDSGSPQTGLPAKDESKLEAAAARVEAGIHPEIGGSSGAGPRPSS